MAINSGFVITEKYEGVFKVSCLNHTKFLSFILTREAILTKLSVYTLTPSKTASTVNGVFRSSLSLALDLQVSATSTSTDETLQTH